MLTDDDKLVWGAVTNGVIPLMGRIAPMEHDGITNHHTYTPYIISQVPVANIPGIDRRLSTEIRRGTIEINRTLDLHGCTIAEAHQTVLRFIQYAHSTGNRRLLVITGKGGESSIRRELPLWLSQPPMKNLILSCTYAHQRQGGSGAFVIVLRK